MPAEIPVAEIPTRRLVMSGGGWMWHISDPTEPGWTLCASRTQPHRLGQEPRTPVVHAQCRRAYEREVPNGH